MLTVGGKNLLVRAIERCMRAASVDCVIVSTDSDVYGELAEAHDAHVHLRSAMLSTDDSSTVDVVFDVLGDIEADTVLVTQCTTPFVRGSDIDASFSLLNDWDAVASVCEARVHPDHLRYLNRDRLEPFYELEQHEPRQKFKTPYRLNGGIYWIHTSAFEHYKTLLPKYTAPYIMDRDRSIDIDTQEDYDDACRDYRRNWDQP